MLTPAGASATAPDTGRHEVCAIEFESYRKAVVAEEKPANVAPILHVYSGALSVRYGLLLGMEREQFDTEVSRWKAQPPPSKSGVAKAYEALRNCLVQTVSEKRFGLDQPESMQRGSDSGGPVLTQQFEEPKPDLPVLYVRLGTQELYFVKGEEFTVYPISGARAGAGFKYGSSQTPTGLHRIKRRIGKNVPEGGILMGGRYIGRKAEIHQDAVYRVTDLVTTRILWLEGMEKGINKGKSADGTNVDSADRQIYIHGTPEEGMIGQPASHGCIRMLNRDVVKIFDDAPVGTFVLIEP